LRSGLSGAKDDVGFGRGAYANDVATYIVKKLAEK
jgi:hypothetical protein